MKHAKWIIVVTMFIYWGCLALIFAKNAHMVDGEYMPCPSPQSFNGEPVEQ